jgi:hypothetical protein
MFSDGELANMVSITILHYQRMNAFMFQTMIR